MQKLIRYCTTLLGTFLLASSASANLPYFPIQFPRDDAAHYENTPYPVNTMMEWWYYNGRLTSSSGRHFGYYLSFNYSQVDLFGKKVTVPFFQIQLTDIDNQKVYARQTFFLDSKTYSMSTQLLDVAFGKDLTLRKENNTYLIDAKVNAYSGETVHLSLQLTPVREPLLVGKTGLVDMWNNTNSYYYSYTNMSSAGYVQINHETLQLDPQQSKSWMDHQWGDFMIIPNQNVWYWTSIQLNNGVEINLGTILDPVTKKVVSGTANIVMPDNTHVYLMLPNLFSYIANWEKGQKHPLTYDLSIPSMQLKLRLTALVPGQDQNGIWEGVSSAVGTYQGNPVDGQAYTENSVTYPN